MMNPKSKTLIISATLGAAFYLLDSVLDSLLFYKDLSFFQVFITDPPIQEIYTRLLGFCIIIILGIIIPVLFQEGGINLKSKEEDHKLSSDPNLMVNVSNQIKTPLNAIMGNTPLWHINRYLNISFLSSAKWLL